MISTKTDKNLAFFVGLIAMIGVATGQLRSNIPVPGNSELTTVAGSSLLDPNRFSMHQGFSMSFTSGSGLGSGSVSVYTNQLSYLVSDKVMLDGTFHVAQPNFSQMPGVSDPQIYYQTGLNWRPSDRIFFRLSLSNLPPYNRFGGNQYYSPYRQIYRRSSLLDELD